MRAPARRAALPAAMALLVLTAAGCGGGDTGAADDPAAGGPDAAPALSDTPGGAAGTPASEEGTAAAPGEEAAAEDAGTSGGGEAGGGGRAPDVGPPAQDPAGPATFTTTGTVALTGTAEAPMLTLRTSDQTWLLQGDPTPELRRLDGATVRVTGRARGEPGRLRPLEVASYEIESVGGERPFVGRIDRSDAGEPVLVTDDGTLRLGGAGDLADQVGARAWVVGRRSGEVLSVGSYGIIRPAS